MSRKVSGVIFLIIGIILILASSAMFILPYLVPVDYGRHMFNIIMGLILLPIGFAFGIPGVTRLVGPVQVNIGHKVLVHLFGLFLACIFLSMILAAFIAVAAAAVPGLPVTEYVIPPPIALQTQLPNIIFWGFLLGLIAYPFVLCYKMLEFG
jgi:hypothetical protein